MKRVFQLAYSLNLAGTENVFMNWYRYIDRTKIQFDFGVLHKFDTPVSKEIINLGGRICIIERGEGLINRIKFLLRLYKTLKKNGPYIAFQSHDHFLCGFVCAVAFFAGIKKRFSISHYNDGENKITFIDRIKRFISRIFIYVFVTERLAVSYDAGKTLYGNYLGFDIVSNGIDCNKFSYNPEKRNILRKKLGLEDKYVVGHIGRFSEQKNHKFLIDIFAEIYKREKSAVLLLLGFGPLENEIKTKVKSLGLEKVVRFEGVKEDVQDYYQVFDVFVFPSLFEGCGIVALEAQCCGLPCIMSNAIPKETFVCNSKVVSLNCSAKTWADSILNNKNEFVRKDESSSLRNAGYDAKEIGKLIEEKYLNQSNRTK